MFRAAFSWRHPKDWRLILTKNTEKTIPTTHNDNPNNRTHIIKFRVTEKEKLTLELEPPHIVRTVQKRGLQGVEQANQRLAWRSESGARPVFVWSRSWL